MIQHEDGWPQPGGSLAALCAGGKLPGLLAGAHPGKKQAEAGQSCGCFTHGPTAAQTGPHTSRLVVLKYSEFSYALR